MGINKADIEFLGKEFKENQNVLTALGDPVRQHIILIMLTMECSGNRVVDIAEKTNLSRPAVSHHMQILKQAGIVESRKEGRLIYYYLQGDNKKINNLIELFKKVKELNDLAPDRSQEAYERGLYDNK